MPPTATGGSPPPRVPPPLPPPVRPPVPKPRRRRTRPEPSLKRSGNSYQSLNDDAGQGTILVNRGAIAAGDNRNEKAIALFTEALAVLQGRDAHALRSRATALLNRGVCLDRLGRREEAIRDNEDALAIFESIDDQRSQGLTLGNLAEFVLAGGDIDRAHGLCHAQLELGRHLDDKFLHAQAHFLNGETHAAASRPTQARREWRKALQLYDQIDHPDAAPAKDRLDAAAGSIAVH